MAQYNECQLAYFQANGATSNQKNDAAYEFLLAQGAAPAQLNDMWFEYLSTLSSGALSDMRDEFWKSVGCQPF